MPKIFISYRRDDAAYPAHAIYETLAAQFGEADVFFDVDSIPPGVSFHTYLTEAVAKCDVLLAIIGDHWLYAQDGKGQRRLDDPDDFVRIEIEAALSRKIPVVPVLVGQAAVPQSQELPQTLSDLSTRNATEIRPGRDFRSHLERLVRDMERYSVAVANPFDISINSIGLRLTLIPAGEFLMGSPDSDGLAHDDEKPLHRVEITQAFYLGVFPVTQTEYQKVMGLNPSHFKDHDRSPVEGVTWLNAVAFCNKLSELEKCQPFYRISGDSVSVVRNSGYRLPTEAEWEYACRAGTTTKWSTGDDASQLKDSAWYSANSFALQLFRMSLYSTHPVGQKKSNPWGLHELHGNVWEWCWDWYSETYYKHSPTNDPRGPTTGEYRVLRGGSFGLDSSFLRSANRTSSRPSECDGQSGFRVARTWPV